MVSLENKWIQLDFNEKAGFFEIIDKIDGVEMVIHAFSSVVLLSQDDEERVLSTFDKSEKSYDIKIISDIHGEGQSLLITLKFESNLIFTLLINIYQDEPFLLFQAAIKSSENAYRVKFFYPLCLSETQQGAFNLSSIKDWRLLRTDWQSWSPIEVIPLNKSLKRPWMKIPKVIMYSTKEKFASGEYLSDYFAVIKNLNTGKFVTLGFISMKDHLTQIRLHVNYKKEEVLKLFAQSTAGAIPLKENQALYSEKLALLINGMDALESLNYYTTLVQKEMKALSWSPVPTGWCSWYYYYTLASQDSFLENAAFLSNHRKELPLEMVQLDDGYLSQKGHNSCIGDWDAQNKRFKNGLAWLANEIKADGFKPGLWVAPFLVSNASKLYKEHPDWVIRDRQGKPFEVNFNVEWGLFNKIYGLDCTHPEVQQWLRALFKTIVEEWGFQYIKLDFLYAAAVDGTFYDKSMNRIQAYRKGLEIIRETVGDNIFLLGCGAPLGPSIGLLNGMRVSGDTYYSFGQPFLFWFLNTFFFAGFEGLPSMKDALKTSMLRAFMHNKFWINDPDCVLVRRTRSSLKPTEIEFEVTLLGLCGGILFSSDKLSELAPEDLDYIKFLLPPSSIPATPLDLFENDPPKYFKLDIPPSESMGAYHLVGIFNWTKKAQPIPLSLEQLNLDSNLNYHVFDFWEKSYYQIDKNNIKEIPLKGHTAKLLAIRPITGGPQLISSTFHITQGNIEISQFEFNPNTLEISIEVVKSGQSHGQLFLYLPRPYHEKELLSDAKQSKLFRRQDELVGIEIDFEDRSQLTLKLEKKE